MSTLKEMGYRVQEGCWNCTNGREYFGRRCELARKRGVQFGTFVEKAGICDRYEKEGGEPLKVVGKVSTGSSVRSVKVTPDE
jgi:hypothetical protein